MFVSIVLDMLKSLWSGKHEAEDQHKLADTQFPHSASSSSFGMAASPDVKKIVSESIEKGLPLIPFGQPNIFALDENNDGKTANQTKKQQSRKNLFHRSNSIMEEEKNKESYMEMRSSLPTYQNDEDYMKMDQVFHGKEFIQSKSLPSYNQDYKSKQNSFGKIFKRANRHKADYAFVDFEKQNYCDMSPIPDKNWKFLSYFPRKRKGSDSS